MFTVELLPARRGDCLWIEYGDGGEVHRVLIDGGPVTAYEALRRRIRTLPESARHFQLFIITHVDADHIEGAVQFLRDRALKVTFGDIWFNGWEQIAEADRQGPLQGEYVTALLKKCGHPWNRAFDGGPVATRRFGRLPRRKLPGGLQLTLLSPPLEGLKRLRPVWKCILREEGLRPGGTRAVLRRLARDRRLRPKDWLGPPKLDVGSLAGTEFKADHSPANGSSIAVLAEYDGKKCLLAGDAPSPTLVAALGRLLQGNGRLALDALKVAHHGSKGSTGAELLQRLSCRNYLISSDGSYYKHPDRELVARVIVHGRYAGPPSLLFNYRSRRNRVWDDARLKGDHVYPYSTVYPPRGRRGLALSL
jgi:hypothetical protein